MFRAARTVVLLSILVQVAAFLRTAIIAAIFGASITVDAYNLGVVAPTFLATVISGWLQIGFVGRYAGLVATNDVATTSVYRGRMLIVLLAVSAVATAFCVLQPDRLMALFLPTGQSRIAADSAAALQMTGWILTPMIVGDFLGLVLNSHGRFFAAAFAPLANAVVSVVLLWLWPNPDLFALTLTLLIGSFVQLLVVVQPTVSIGVKFLLHREGAKDEVVPTILTALPLLPAVVLANSASAIVQFRSAQLGEGAVAIFGYASKLHGALSQAMVIGLGTVLLPHFGSLWARKEEKQIVALLRRLVRISILLSAYFGTGIYLMGIPAVATLFQRGAFDAELVGRVADIWTILSVSLFPFAIGTFIAKFCQALRGSFIVLLSSALSFATIWSVSFVGVKEQSLAIITLSWTVAFSTTAIFWLLWLSRIVPSSRIAGDIFAGVLRAVIVFLPATIVDFLIRAAIEAFPLILNVLIRGIVFSGVACALMFAIRSWKWFLGHDVRDGIQE